MGSAAPYVISGSEGFIPGSVGSAIEFMREKKSKRNEEEDDDECEVCYVDGVKIDGRPRRRKRN